MLEIIIPGKAISWKSPTVVQKPSKPRRKCQKAQKRDWVCGSCGAAHPVQRMAFPDKKMKAWEKEVSDHAGKLDVEILEGPIELEIDIFMPRPKRCDKKKEIAIWGSGPVPSTTRPDRVNLVKAIEDGMNGIIWKDDSQVWDCNARKWFHEQGGEPRVEIRVYETPPFMAKPRPLKKGPIPCS